MVALLQPSIPLYRENFFEGLKDRTPIDIYCYDNKAVINEGVKLSNIASIKLNTIKIGPFVLYNVFPFFKKKYSVLVLMLNYGHISTWILLLTRFIHKKEIILWGHGISVKRFQKEDIKPDIFLSFMVKLADIIWFYTPYELKLWKNIYPALNGISLNNTVSDADTILGQKLLDKDSLKIKYKIDYDKVIIYCARFNIAERRTDLLEDAIRILDTSKFGFIIIGDGPYKPDLAKYKNVHDYGALYDRQVKSELFQLADIYFQPAWVGLSIVEAMSYGKPIFTFKRSETLLQCVEYSYIKNEYNGLIFENLTAMVEKLCTLTHEQIAEMSKNSLIYAANELTLKKMIDRAFNSLQKDYKIVRRS